MDSGSRVQTSLWTGCPIRNLKAHRLHAAPLERFVGLHVLLRPDAPRHPPRTLARLSALPASLPQREPGEGTHERVCVLASAFLLFALGTIEVSIQLFGFQCASLLVLRYYATLRRACQGVFWTKMQGAEN